MYLHKSTCGGERTRRGVRVNAYAILKTVPVAEKAPELEATIGEPITPDELCREFPLDKGILTNAELHTAMPISKIQIIQTSRKSG